jgi:hypothetical protein
MRERIDPIAVSCLIRRCGHLGALGQLLLPAPEAGMIAMLCQRTALRAPNATRFHPGYSCGSRFKSSLRLRE